MDLLVLSEADKARLDGILEKMIANKESDENIQWVVNDFKQKYGTNPGAPSSVENGPWEDYQHIAARKTTKERIHIILYAFLYWLISCIVLYAAGKSIYWVYKGFNNKDGRTR